MGNIFLIGFSLAAGATTIINANNSREIEFLNKMNLKIFMLPHIAFGLVVSPSTARGSQVSLLRFPFIWHSTKHSDRAIVVCSLFTTPGAFSAAVASRRSSCLRSDGLIESLASYPGSEEESDSTTARNEKQNVFCARKEFGTNMENEK